MKKAIAILSVLCLLMTLFAGCSGQSTAPSEVSSPVQADPPVTEPEQPKEPSEEPTEPTVEESVEEPSESTVEEPMEDPSESIVEEPAEVPYESIDMRIAVLKGSTGMGMAKLMADAETAANRYTFTLSSDASDVMVKLISGEYDIAALPTNTAAMAYAKTQGEIQMMAINTLGVLYLLQQTGVDGSPIRSFEDLRGQTIVAMGQGANPEYVLAHLLACNGLTIGKDVTVDWKATVDEVLATLVTGTYDFVMLPEPNVSAAMSKNSDYTIAFDLTQEWENVSDGSLVMGCLAVRKAFADEHPEAMAKFLEEYAASIAFIVSDETAPAVIAAQEIVPAEGIARKALPNCHIVCITGEEMRPVIEPYYQVLFEANPKAVGGAVPDEGFYYVNR